MTSSFQRMPPDCTRPTCQFCRVKLRTPLLWRSSLNEISQVFVIDTTPTTPRPTLCTPHPPTFLSPGTDNFSARWKRGKTKVGKSSNFPSAMFFPCSVADSNIDVIWIWMEWAPGFCHHCTGWLVQPKLPFWATVKKILWIVIYCRFINFGKMIRIYSLWDPFLGIYSYVINKINQSMFKIYCTA